MKKTLPALSPERPSVYAAASYRLFLRADLAHNSSIRGYQKRLSEAAGCRASYLSRVMNSHVHLTLDQGAGLADFWRLNDAETEYFLALVGTERSSSAKLRRHLEGRMRHLRQLNARLSQRVKSSAIVSVATQSVYYANWYTPAIHVLLGIKTMRTPQVLSTYLRLPVALVQECLTRLVEHGLVAHTGLGYCPTEKSLHIGDQSPFHAMYHGNWRQKAVLKAQEAGSDELHFTGLFALSEEAADEIRELALSLVTRSRAIAVAAETETTGVCLLCDFFRI